MSAWKDLDKLSTSELYEIEQIVKQLRLSDAEGIKSSALYHYINHGSTTGDVFVVQCYVVALGIFLNHKGYKIIKKDEKDGK